MNFILKYKRLLLIIGFILSVFIFAYLVYIILFQGMLPDDKTSETASSTLGQLPDARDGRGNIIGQGTTTGSLIPSGQNGQAPGPGVTPIDKIAKGGLTEVTSLNNTPSLGVTLSKDGNELLYYNQNDGLFYRIDASGNAVPLNDKVFHSVENITWSPKKDKAILEYPDGSNIIYDFDHNQQITLPAHWKDFDFSADGGSIVMKSIGLDPGNRWLAVVNADGSGSKKIELIGKNEDIVYPSWQPNNQTIAMYTQGVDFDRQEVFFVGQNNENFKSAIIEGRKFQPLWSPKGDKLLYSVYSSATNLNPSLWVVNAEGDAIGSGRKSLNIQTWADKCAFSSASTLYCAVPNELPEGAGIFPELADRTIDSLYKIDIQTGTKKMIAVPDGAYNISDIQISSDEKNLFFTDKANKNIHKINL